jgi:putative transposase
VIVEYIDDHIAEFGVEPICRMLTEHSCTVSPSTYYDARNRQQSKRSVRDEELKTEITRVHEENYSVYGARKVWLQLARENITVARCTIERLMGDLRREGARRGKTKRTTVADPQAYRADDMVERQFNLVAPNVLRVADFTYVSSWSGWVYVAFVIDAFSRRILGWRSSTTMATPLVLDVIEHAIWTRGREGVTDLSGLIHHNDRGSQLRFKGSSSGSSRPASIPRSGRPGTATTLSR